jgi:hypothetical protein
MAIPGSNLKAGWGVLRARPWHLAGVFASSGEAEKFMRELGAGYVIKYGDHRVGTDEFTFEQDLDS